jgi:hypothetical protein
MIDDEDLGRPDTDRGFGARFDREAGATCGGWTRFRKPGAYNHTLGTQWSARSNVGRGVWGGGMSPIGSGARTRRVKGIVVGWATAESRAAGCGAGRDRMTSVPRRSS